MSDRIFDPKAKIYANADRALDLLQDKMAAPVLVEIDPSNTCNHGCYFCISSYIHLPEYKHLATYNKTIMSREVLLKVCRDLVEIGARAINWTGGGEPTVNKHLREAIEYIGTNSDIQMGMFTNGTLLDKWNMFETVVNYLTWIRFSVDAGTPETYNSIRRTRDNQGWDKMMANLNTLIDVNKKKIQIGVGFVITPNTYKEIVAFAKNFAPFDVDYCQFKPEIVNREREGGIQRDLEFWQLEVEPRLSEAREILGNKFQINGYKLTDLVQDRSLFGRSYKKCFGSQLQPCIGADGEVYVCTNHRGYKQYSYGSLLDHSFTEIWNNMQKRKGVMHQIESVECFKNCTNLCKPHESNKALWEIYQELARNENAGVYKEKLLREAGDIRSELRHADFI